MILYSVVYYPYSRASPSPFPPLVQSLAPRPFPGRARVILDYIYLFIYYWLFLICLCYLCCLFVIVHYMFMFVMFISSLHLYLFVIVHYVVMSLAPRPFPGRARTKRLAPRSPETKEEEHKQTKQLILNKTNY